MANGIFDLGDTQGESPFALSKRRPLEERLAEIQALPTDLTEIPTLEKAIDVTEQLLSGAIPEDVLAQVKQATAEQVVQGGLGQGQAGLFLQARDIGATSFEIQQRGVAQAFELAKVLSGREEFEAETALRLQELGQQLQIAEDSFAGLVANIQLQEAQLEEQTREFDKKFEVMLQETELRADQIKLLAAEYISQNQRFTQNLVASLIQFSMETPLNEAAMAELENYIINLLGSEDAEVPGFFDPTNKFFLEAVYGGQTNA